MEYISEKSIIFEKLKFGLLQSISSTTKCINADIIKHTD